MTLQDDPGSRMARTALASSPEGEAGRAPPFAPVAVESGRYRYAVGVFAAPSDAHGVLAALASAKCDVLVVSAAAPSPAAGATPAASGHVLFRQIESSGALAASLAATLSEAGPFTALGVGVQPAVDDALPSAGMQRLFQNLVHHLATGATVVIIHVSGPEQQLQVSRALLEAHCDTLLTHDVRHAGDAPRAASARCAGCAAKSNGRSDFPTPSD